MSIVTDFFRSILAPVVFNWSAGNRSKPVPRRFEENEIVRAIVDCTAAHVGKAQVMHIVRDKDGRVKRVLRNSAYTKLFERPNPVMTKQDLLYAMTYQLLMKNTALAWVDWETYTKPAAIWPLAYSQFVYQQTTTGDYVITVTDTEGQQHHFFAADVIVLRRHYDGSGAAGLSNAPIRQTVEVAGAIDEALTSSVQTSRIHGVLSKKKAMLANSAVKDSQAEFRDRLNDAAQNGAIVVDSMESFTPFNFTAWSANAAQTKQVYDRLFTYWRTPMEVVTNAASEQVMQNYYSSVVELVWQEMEQAFSAALFSARELDTGNRIMLTSGAASGASWQTKLQIVAASKETGLLMINEQRELLGYPPTEDGDVRLVSLNFVKSTDQSKYQTGADAAGEGGTDAVQTE